jgi:hypothetical protein
MLPSPSERRTKSISLNIENFQPIKAFLSDLFLKAKFANEV